MRTIGEITVRHRCPCPSITADRPPFYNRGELDISSITTFKWCLIKAAVAHIHDTQPLHVVPQQPTTLGERSRNIDNEARTLYQIRNSNIKVWNGMQLHAFIYGGATWLIKVHHDCNHWTLMWDRSSRSRLQPYICFGRWAASVCCAICRYRIVAHIKELLPDAIFCPMLLTFTIA